MDASPRTVAVPPGTSSLNNLGTDARTLHHEQSGPRLRVSSRTMRLEAMSNPRSRSPHPSHPATQPLVNESLKSARTTAMALSSQHSDDSTRSASKRGVLSRLATGSAVMSDLATRIPSISTYLARTPLPFRSPTNTPTTRNTFMRAPVRVGTLSATDKFTQKWPQPRALHRANTGLSAASHWHGQGAGAWDERQMKTILEEGKSLGVDSYGQWTTHKWCLFFSVITVFICGIVGLAFAILTWFAAYPAAPVVLITDSAAIILLTFSSSLLLLASVLGMTGTLLNSRPILAFYVILLFPAFVSFTSIGYVTYRKSIYSLDGKLSEAWNDWYFLGARSVIQCALGCCGWTDALHGAAPSGTCYPRTPLPGCRGPLFDFEQSALRTIFSAVFALVPLHIINIFVGLLCANHVTHRFGKGIMPKQYRLHVADVVSLSRNTSVTSSTYSPAGPVDIGHPAIAKRPDASSVIFREDRRGGAPGQ